MELIQCSIEKSVFDDEVVAVCDEETNEAEDAGLVGEHETHCSGSRLLQYAQ